MGWNSFVCALAFHTASSPCSGFLGEGTGLYPATPSSISKNTELLDLTVDSSCSNDKEKNGTEAVLPPERLSF
jgi:hypothetical protein